MLALKPNCECCDKDLPPASEEAMICTFECTFCADCAGRVFGGVCPNCGGGFVARPIRPGAPAGEVSAVGPTLCARAALRGLGVQSIIALSRRASNGAAQPISLSK